MATRKTETPAVVVDDINVVELYSKIVEFAPTDEFSVTVAELNDEMSGNTFAALNVLADAELISFETVNGGRIFNAIPDVSEANAAETVYGALMDTSFSANVPEAPKPKRERLEYSVKAAESQDEVMSQAPDVTEIQFAEIMAKGEPPQDAADPKQNGGIIPVDFDDLSKGRRELDASKGEKVLGETSYTVSEKRWTPEFSEPKNEPYEGPESIQSVPAGVTENTWFMAHYANTQSARDWWMSKAVAQWTEAGINKGEPAPF